MECSNFALEVSHAVNTGVSLVELTLESLHRPLLVSTIGIRFSTDDINEGMNLHEVLKAGKFLVNKFTRVVYPLQ